MTEYESPNSQKPHRGVLILTLGILSLVVCQPLGIAAWVMGNTDLREMDQGRMDREGEQFTQAGKICGIVGTILFGLALLWFFIVALLAGVSMVMEAGS